MYTFLIRHLPDIEYATPIIHKLASSGEKEITVFCQNPGYDIEDNVCLWFLRKEHGITARYIYGENLGFRLKWLLMEFAFYMKKKGASSKGSRYFTAYFDNMMNYHYDEAWARAFFKKHGTKVLALDYMPERQYLTATLTKTARKLGIQVVLLPNGQTMLQPNRDCENDAPSSYPKFARGDHYLIPSKFTIHGLQIVYGPDTELKIMGCSRYCREWLLIFNEMVRGRYPANDLPNNLDKLNVVVFSRSTIGFGEDSPVLAAIKALPFVDVVFRGKPRGPHRNQGSRYPSARLIQWADVVVMASSGIILEVLDQKKALLYLHFLEPGRNSVFMDYDACWPVDSQEELMKALETLHEDKTYRPYSEDSVNRLFRDCVYNGNITQDILGEYAQFFQSIKGHAEIEMALKVNGVS